MGGVCQGGIPSTPCSNAGISENTAGHIAFWETATKLKWVSRAVLISPEDLAAGDLGLSDHQLS